jgi:4'-phosphopantetheinyl transferase EntD
LASAFEKWCGTGVACDAELTALAEDASFSVRRARRKQRAVLRAMAQVGGPARVPEIGSSGEPVWPAGWVGSISHAEPYSVAVVAPARDARAVGVDLQTDHAVSKAFAARVCSERELQGLRAFGADAEQLSAVVFSAKEAVYKLRFPLSREAWSLRRASVHLNACDFVATFRDAAPPFPQGFEVSGEWRRQRGVILTGTWLPSGARGTP